MPQPPLPAAALSTPRLQPTTTTTRGQTPGAQQPGEPPNGQRASVPSSQGLLNFAKFLQFRSVPCRAVAFFFYICSVKLLKIKRYGKTQSISRNRLSVGR